MFVSGPCVPLSEPEISACMLVFVSEGDGAAEEGDGAPGEQLEGRRQDCVRTGLTQAEARELPLVLHFFSQKKAQVQQI